MLKYIINLLLTILTFFKLYKNRCLSFPSTMEYYIIKNSSLQQQIKISQTSKTMLNFVQRIRNYDFNQLTIIPNEKFALSKDRFDDIITAFIGMKTLEKINKIIFAKHDLEFFRLTLKDFILVKQKIKTAKNNNSRHGLLLRFDECQINQAIVEYFFVTSIDFLIIHKNCEICDEYNLIINLWNSMPQLNCISVPWQKMSMEELANLKRKNKLKYCKFDGIPEIFCPELIVKFIENNIKYNGYLCLIYLEPITIAAADFYEENVCKLVKVKISSNFQIEINHRKYII